VSPKTILILAGGGALGAYECGVYQALAPRLENLSVVAGTSIGAINASLIARNYQQKADRGVADLTHFWTEVLANPFLPVFPGPGLWQRWNARWTSLVCGNPHLFTPQLWNFLAPLFATSFYSTQAMEQTLDHYFEGYGPQGTGPRLIVTALDVEAGTPKAFDSWQERITPAQVVAGSSLPPGFPAKEVAGRFYWDGGLWSNTPLPEVLNVLQAHPAEEPAPAYQVYIVDVFPQQAPLPQTSLEVAQRMADMIFADKTAYESKKAAEWVNRYLQLVRTLHEDYAAQLPPTLAADIAREYEQLLRVDKRVILDITHITRSALRDEVVPSAMSAVDFSPEWIQALIAQGHRDARHALEAMPPSQPQQGIPRAG
jgi:NTE family protein